MSEGKAFSACGQKPCNLIGRLWWHKKLEYFANGMVISITAGWNGKSRVPPTWLSICSRKFQSEPRVSFAFQPAGLEILAKWKVPQQSKMVSTHQAVLVVQ